MARAELPLLLLLLLPLASLPSSAPPGKDNRGGDPQGEPTPPSALCTCSEARFSQPLPEQYPDAGVSPPFPRQPSNSTSWMPKEEEGELLTL